MSYAIVTDAGSAFSPDMLQLEDFYIIPMSVMIESSEYPYVLFDDKTSHDFFDTIRSGKMPTTSQPNQFQVEEVLKQAFDSKKDIIYLGFSDKLSGTFNLVSDVLADFSKEYPNQKVCAINTKAGSGGQALLVHKAIELRKQGDSFEDTCNKVKDLIDQTCHWFTVENMETLRRGGRIGYIKSKAVDALNIKPILRTDKEGALQAFETVRGRKRSIKNLFEKYQNYAHPDAGELACIICHGDSYDDAYSLKEMICKNCQINSDLIELLSIGPIIGSHTGPGSIALFFFGNKL